MQTVRFPGLLRASRITVILMGALIASRQASGQAALTARSHAAVAADGGVAGAVLAASALAFTSAEMALKRSSSPAVRSFAETVVEDHSHVILQVRQLIEQLGIEPVPSASSDKLRSRGRSIVESLAPLHGGAFDDEFIAQTRAYHLALLELLDEELIPGTASAELRGLLGGVRSLVVVPLATAN